MKQKKTNQTESSRWVTLRPAVVSTARIWSVYHLAPEAPFFRGMLTGPGAFSDPPGASGLRPCARIYLKKGLVPHSSGWWGRGQKPLIDLLWRVNPSLTDHFEKKICYKFSVGFMSVSFVGYFIDFFICVSQRRTLTPFLCNKRRSLSPNQFF